MMVRKSFGVWVLVGLAFVGCKSSSDEGANGDIVGTPSHRPDNTAAARAALEPLVSAMCEWHFNCCTVGQLAVAGLGASASPEDCVDRIFEAASTGQFYISLDSPLRWAPGYLNYLGYDLDLGRVTVDDEALDACEKAMSEQECAPKPVAGCQPAEQAAVPECEIRKILNGRQKEGDPCHSVGGGIECAPGLICSQLGEEGVCVEGAQKDAPCFYDYECPSPLVCDYMLGVCVEGAGEGDECSYVDPAYPESGTEKDRCRVGLVCDPRTNECVSSGCGWGAACGEDNDCEDGLVCIVGDCREKSALLGPCSDADDCGSGRCDQISRVCISRAANGVACGSDGDCESNRCEGAVCTATGKSGTACASDRECSGWCNQGLEIPACAPHLKAGDECLYTDQCGDSDEIACLGGTCAELPLPLGKTCALHEQCVSGFCDEDFECAEKADGGAACTPGSYGQCGQGLYCEVDAEEGTGMCRPWKDPGEECDYSPQCPYSNCNPVAGVFRCGERPSQTEAMCDGLEE